MKQKTSLNIKKRVLTSIAVSALALATVAGAVNFGTIADAARGVLDNTAEYGEQLKDHAPSDLNLSELQDSSDTWYWVDNPDTYFGKPGEQKFVVANADLNNGGIPTAYKEVTVPVQKRSVAPVVKQGTISGTAANYTTTAKASIDRYKRTITVTAGEGGTVSGSGTYVIGESVSISATPAEGYKFTGWSDGDDSNPRTITINDDMAYTATFESDSMKVTSKLPEKIGDISIMTIKQLYTALGGSANSGHCLCPARGLNSSPYYVYAINDTPLEDDALSNSTSTNLQAVGSSWYKKLNKPATYSSRWDNAGSGYHSVFGGPLDSIGCNSGDMYSFGWSCNDGFGTNSRERYWHNTVSGSVYVAVVCADDTMTVTQSLPTEIGNVSIMTLAQAYTALGGSSNSIYDPTQGYSSSTYYIYAINDTPGTDDAITKSTSANLKAVGVDWYKQLEKPTTADDNWTVGSHKVFGGPLSHIYFSGSSYYSFGWYCAGGNYCYSNDSNYWKRQVAGNVCVAVVRAK